MRDTERRQDVVQRRHPPHPQRSVLTQQSSTHLYVTLVGRSKHQGVVGGEVWFGYHNRRSVKTLPLYGSRQMPILITLVNLKKWVQYNLTLLCNRHVSPHQLCRLARVRASFCVFSLYLFWFRLADYLLKSGARIARKCHVLLDDGPASCHSLHMITCSKFKASEPSMTFIISISIHKRSAPSYVQINFQYGGVRCTWVRRAIKGWFSNRTGTSVDDGERKSNNWLDQRHSGKLGTGSRV